MRLFAATLAALDEFTHVQAAGELLNSLVGLVQAQWNSGTMLVQIEMACAVEANWRLELGKVRRTAESLLAKVRRGEIVYRLRAGGISPRLKT